MTLILIGGSDSSFAFELAGPAAEMAAQINSMREARGLDRLEVDAIVSDVMAKVLSKNLEELGAALFAGCAAGYWPGIAEAPTIPLEAVER